MSVCQGYHHARTKLRFAGFNSNTWLADTIAELLETFLTGEDLLLLPELPVLVDQLLRHPLRAFLQGLLLAVAEVRLEGGGEGGPGGGGVDVSGDDDSDPGGENSPHPHCGLRCS